MLKKLVLPLIFLLPVSFSFAQQSSVPVTEEKSYYDVTYYKSGDKKVGEYKETYKQNGNTKTTGSYFDDKKSGVWKYYTIAGIITKEETYQNGVLNGITNNYDDGLLIETLNFRNGELNGKCQKFYSDGKLSEQTIYINGKRKSFHSYYQSGKPKEVEIIPDNPAKTYQNVQYYESGVKRSISVLKNGECIKYTSFHTNGKVSTVSELVDGQLKMVERYSAEGMREKVDCGC